MGGRWEAGRSGSGFLFFSCSCIVYRSKFMIGYVLAGARIFSPEIFTKSHHDERTSAPSSTAVFVVAMPLPGRRDDGGKETRYQRRRVLLHERPALLPGGPFEECHYRSAQPVSKNETQLEPCCLGFVPERISLNLWSLSFRTPFSPLRCRHQLWIRLRGFGAQLVRL